MKAEKIEKQAPKIVFYQINEIRIKRRKDKNRRRKERRGLYAILKEKEEKISLFKSLHRYVKWLGREIDL